MIFYIFCVANVLEYLINWNGHYLLSSSFCMALYYIFSKKDPMKKISFFFMLQIKAQYFPWVIMLLNFAQGGNVISDLLGIGIGHSWIFFKVIYSQKVNRDYLATPNWFMRAFNYIYARVEGYNLYGAQRQGQFGRQPEQP